MKLTGGFFKGRVLAYEKTSRLRPTRSIVREAIFDILRNQVKGSYVLELFAGTGALGFEALSRGASFVTFVDSSSQAIRLLLKNSKLLNLKGNFRIVKMEAESALKKFAASDYRFDIVFADPPYSLDTSKLVKIFLGVLKILSDDGVFILETGSKNNVHKDVQDADFKLIKEKIYGSARIQIYQKKRTSRSISG
ncbi:MAG: 16S rRNA (guanine(966)-N(2))-methyltransferase RsmD [Candidatus Omnitrophica bacterium]|nr:16S rRNA (guanine(966)-N(2))-methyltransferase RsmD [Candidatus Omnitrophota bacterium]